MYVFVCYVTVIGNVWMYSIRWTSNVKVICAYTKLCIHLKWKNFFAWNLHEYKIQVRIFFRIFAWIQVIFACNFGYIPREWFLDFAMSMNTKNWNLWTAVLCMKTKLSNICCTPLDRASEVQLSLTNWTTVIIKEIITNIGKSTIISNTI